MTTEMAIDLATLEQIPVVVITLAPTGRYQFEATCSTCLDTGMEIWDAEGKPTDRPKACAMCRPLSRIYADVRVPR